MGYRKYKNSEGLIARKKVRIVGSEDYREPWPVPQEYFEVYLWESREAMVANGLPKEDFDGAGAAVVHVPSLVSWACGGWIHKPRKKLSEVHFVKQDWDDEVIAHELIHVLGQCFRYVEPSPVDFAEQNGNSDEIVAYRFGKWVHVVTRWLWEHDPSSEWQRVEPCPSEDTVVA